MRGEWRAYFELMRFPAVFTAVADVLMGYLVTQSSFQPPWAVALLVVASSLIYLAGMVLNDVHDVEVDAFERPQRPIPSGRIPLTSAQRLGWGLLVCGVIAAWLVGYLAGNFRPGIVAALLAASVVLYDIVLKSTAVAPLLMGSCRLLNVLLGMSLAETTDTMLPRPWTPSEWAIAIGVGIYIAGITWFARTEARVSSRGQLLGGVGVMLAGLLTLATSPQWSPPRPVHFLTEQGGWPLLWIALGLVILGRCSIAVLHPEPRRIQVAVRNSLRALIVLDAAIVLGWVGPTWGCAVIALLFPMLLLERWFSTT